MFWPPFRRSSDRRTSPTNTARAFRRAIQSLSAANVLGVVLNDVEYGDTRYAYAYRHYQRHYLDQA